MTKTMKIEGMMCPHCEATVKKALEAIDGVESAEVSHTAGTAVVTGTALDDAKLKAAVEDKGYTVHGLNKKPDKQPMPPRKNAAAFFDFLLSPGQNV